MSLINPNATWFKLLMRGSIVGVSYYTAFEYPFPQNHVFLPLRRWKRRLERDWFDRPYDEAADLAAVAEFERLQRLKHAERLEREAARTRVVRPPRSAAEADEMQRTLRSTPAASPRQSDSNSSGSK